MEDSPPAKLSYNHNTSSMNNNSWNNTNNSVYYSNNNSTSYSNLKEKELV